MFHLEGNWQELPIGVEFAESHPESISHYEERHLSTKTTQEYAKNWGCQWPSRNNPIWFWALRPFNRSANKNVRARCERTRQRPYDIGRDRVQVATRVASWKWRHSPPTWSCAGAACFARRRSVTQDAKLELTLWCSFPDISMYEYRPIYIDSWNHNVWDWLYIEQILYINTKHLSFGVRVELVRFVHVCSMLWLGNMPRHSQHLLKAKVVQSFQVHVGLAFFWRVSTYC